MRFLFLEAVLRGMGSTSLSLPDTLDSTSLIAYVESAKALFSVFFDRLIGLPVAEYCAGNEAFLALVILFSPITSSA